MLGTAASIHGPRSYIPAAGSNAAASGKLAPSYFEPRYRAMVEYALSHGRFVGMIQPVPDKKQADGRSVLYDVGCIGRLTSFRELPDGRFLIVLDGLCRFRPVRELVSTPWVFAR